MDAYLDESTDQNQSQVFAVAGWIGAEEAWHGFSLDWRIRTLGLPVFHMTEVETNKGSFSAENGWSKTQCVDLITDLVTAISRYNLFGFGCGVLIPDFKTVFPNERLVSMYLLCFRHCVYQLVQWSPEPVGFVFDIHKQFQQKAQELYVRLIEIAGGEWKQKLGAIKFGSRSEYLPLQSADFIAYETFKRARNTNYHFDVAERKSMARIAETRRVAMEVYTKDALEGIREELMSAQADTLWEYLAVTYRDVQSMKP